MTEKKQTKERVLTTAVTMAETDGVLGVTRNGLAEKAGVAQGLISYHFNTMHQLRKAVVRRAVHEENLTVLLSVLTSAKYGDQITGDLRAKVIGQLS